MKSANTLSSRLIAYVHVLVITAVPAKGRAIAGHHPAQIDAAIVEEMTILYTKIVADRRHDTDRREETSRQRKIADRSAERGSNTAVLRFDRVVSNRTDRDNTHRLAILISHIG